MQFLNPGFLWALLAIAIPIIIHLFNFRRFKTVYFSNIGFLKNVKLETKRRSTLKNLLILLLRILTIIFLVMVFAKPYIPVDKSTVISETPHVAIYIDNSFSMEAEGTKGVLLDNAKLKAKEICESYPADARFLLITNELLLKHQRFVSRDQVSDWISQITVTHISQTINNIIQKAMSLWPHNDTNTLHQMFILSDFQKNIFSNNQFPVSPNLQVYAVPFTDNPISNIFIDSVWFETPSHYKGKSEKIFVAVKNISEDDFYELPLQLHLNDTIAATASFSIGAKATQVVSLSFSKWNAGKFNGVIALVDYPITFDNKFYFNFEIAEKKQVLIVNEEQSPGYFAALFKDDDQILIHETKVADIPYNALQSYQVIILNGLTDISSGLTSYLKTYVYQGGVILFNPAINGELTSYNTFIEPFVPIKLTAYQEQEGEMANFDFEHIFLKNAVGEVVNNARMPGFNGYFGLQSQSVRAMYSTIFGTESGSPLFIENHYGQGVFYLSGVPLTKASTDFVIHPLFVPIFYNMALFAQYQVNYQYYIKPGLTIEINTPTMGGGNYSLFEQVSGNELKPRFKLGQNSLKFFPDIDQVTASFYRLQDNETIIGNISLNFDRKESEMYFFTHKELIDELHNLQIESAILMDANSNKTAPFLDARQNGKSLSNLFLYLALLTLIIEMVVLRNKNN